MSGPLAALEGDAFPLQVVRAMRNATYFATETRVPYGIVNIVLRDVLFGSDGRQPVPLEIKLDSIADGTLSHAWILARIAAIFKTTELLLARAEGVGEPSEWHSFVAGCAAGYAVMGPVASKADYKLKQQVNMFVAIRTMWSLAGYMLRKDMLSGIAPAFRPHSEAARECGWTAFVTLVWGTVMWHWRHQDKVASKEMPVAMARSMDFIYTAGDTPGMHKWTTRSGYVFAVIALYRLARGLQRRGGSGGGA